MRDRTRREAHFLHVNGNQMVRLAKPLEPERSNLGQNAALVRNPGRQDPIEGADPVGATSNSRPPRS